MFASAFRRLTLGNFALDQWREASVLHRLLSPFRRWRQGSWLMAWGDGIVWVFVAVMLAIAPYASTTMIGYLLLISAGFWLMLTVSDRARGWLTPLHLVVMVYWGAMAIATIFSPVKAEALSGLIILTLNVLLFMLLARILRIKELRSSLIFVYLFTAAIVSAYGIRQAYFGAEALATWVDPTSSAASEIRVYSYLNNPNLLAAYLLPAVSFSAVAAFVWPKWLPKLLAVSLFVMNAACLVLTRSRGGWLGLLATLFLLMVLLVFWWNPRLSAFWRRWSLPILLGGSAAVVVAAVVFVPSIRGRVVSIANLRGDSSNNFRLNVYEAVFDMIQAYPITGIGPGNEAFNRIYPLFQRPRYTALSAYSIYFETAVEGGIIGLAAFFWMLAVAFQQGWVQLKRLRQLASDWLADVQMAASEGYWLIGALGGMAGLLVQGAFDTVWYRPQISTLWWMSMAVVASLYVDMKRKYSEADTVTHEDAAT